MGAATKTLDATASKRRSKAGSCSATAGARCRALSVGGGGTRQVCMTEEGHPVQRASLARFHAMIVGSSCGPGAGSGVRESCEQRGNRQAAQGGDGRLKQFCAELSASTFRSGVTEGCTRCGAAVKRKHCSQQQHAGPARSLCPLCRHRIRALYTSPLIVFFRFTRKVM